VAHEALKVEGLDCGPEGHEAARAGVRHGGGDAGGEILPSEAVFAKFGSAPRSAKTELHEMPENLKS